MNIEKQRKNEKQRDKRKNTEIQIIERIKKQKKNRCKLIINLEKYYKNVIIYIDGALFQSYKLYEGGAKNPLKGTSLKFLVCARNASFVCIQGVKRLG